MKVMRIYLTVLILSIGCQRAGAIAEKTVSPAPVGKQATDVSLEPQLKINKEVLLNTSDEQMRITAVNLLLNHSDPNARRILIETLNLTNNKSARMAICKSLIQTRSSKPITKKEDFIQPLLGVLSSEDAEEVKLAAQATLIYQYEEIGQSLESLTADTAKPILTRLNAISALQIQPAPEAAIKLLRLVDDPEKQIAEGAEKALLSLGILAGAGTSKEDRSRIINDILTKGIETYLREKLVTQDSLIGKINADFSSLLKAHLSLLEKTYQGYNDDAVKDKFIIENLGNTWPAVRLWAIEKVSQRRQGSTTPKLPSELGPILINLLSDADKDVRFKTAALLSIMGELNPAQALLARLKVETNEQVKVQLAETLGSACYNALSQPGKLPPEIRAEVLDLGAKFLAEQDIVKAQVGARILRKLLERDGLKSDDVERYLGLLSARYQQLKDNPSISLRGELLNAMAGLVAQTSSCKAQAGVLFEPIFKEALSDKTADSIRETAVAGLINVNDTAALKILRTGFINDSSENIRGNIIQLAQKIGGKEDIPWLVEKLGASSENQLAWQAILKIFSNFDAATIMAEISKLTVPGSQNTVSAEQKIALYEKAEAKATSENKTDIIKSAREKMAESYYNTNKFDKAVEYYNKLLVTAKTPEDIKPINSRLMDAYLRWPKIDLAVELVKDNLSKSDLDTEDGLIRSIDNYLVEMPSGSDPNLVIKSFVAIEPSQSRPKWQKQIKTWKSRISASN
jgi:HEAT repeat protein